MERPPLMHARQARRRQAQRYLRRLEKLPPEEQRLHFSILLAWLVRVLSAEATRRRQQTSQ